MKIRRLNEKVEDPIYWYFEIRYYHSGNEYIIMDLDENFDDFDWDSVAEYGEDIQQNLDVYSHLMAFLMMETPENTYKLVKITEEVISNDKIDMIISTSKYNI